MNIDPGLMPVYVLGINYFTKQVISMLILWINI